MGVGDRDGGRDKFLKMSVQQDFAVNRLQRSQHLVGGLTQAFDDFNGCFDICGGASGCSVVWTGRLSEVVAVTAAQVRHNFQAKPEAEK